MPQTLIETVRCTVRPFRENDLKDLSGILSDPEVMEHLEPPFTAEKTRSFLLRCGLCEDPLIWAVEIRSSGELAGYLIFHPFGQGSYEVGWVLKKSLWRQGLASELTDVLIPYAKKMNLKALVIECDPDQAASVRIAVRHGFRLKEAGDLLVYRLDLPGGHVIELPYFHIGDSCGGNQDWFRTFKMRMGGCGAATACDSSIYFARQFRLSAVYPYDPAHLTKETYIEFAHKMEHYLWPRMTGINRLDIYIEGYGRYLSDRGETRLSMSPFDGAESSDAADAFIKEQLDSGYPVPALILNHRNSAFSDYVWHWFLITGYDAHVSSTLVKAVTYGKAEWLPLKDLWNTGFSQRGGFIRYSVAPIPNFSSDP